MPEIRLGILGGGQLGSMLSVAAKKLNIKTLIYSDDQDAPAQNFCDEFMFGDYKDKNKINDFVKKSICWILSKFAILTNYSTFFLKS